MLCQRIPAGPVSTGALDELDDEELEKLNELEDSESEDDDSDEVADTGVDDVVVATDEAEADVARLEDVTPGVGEGEGSGFEPPPPPPQAVINILRKNDEINKPFRFIKFSI